MTTTTHLRYGYEMAKRGAHIIDEGYCPSCHEMKPANEGGACETCEGALIDVHERFILPDEREAGSADTPVDTSPVDVIPPPEPPPPPPPPQVVAEPLPTSSLDRPCGSCGTVNPKGSAYCASCGGPLTATAYPAYSPGAPSTAPGMAPPTLTYQPGMGTLSVLPSELNGWNWGAFLFNWIWGLGNQVYVALWLIPISIFTLGLGTLPFMIWLGVKGNERSWKSKRWESVERFREVQRKWAIAGLIVAVVSGVLWIAMAVLGFLESATETAGVFGFPWG